ncbi:MAG: class I SAM-dependent methyltransferase [Patescibacteria group bacterium]|nr:class I SAM-dependent methyltransferase [Patescibacteria group bacterium]
MDKKILNIGCGTTRIPDSIGVDRTFIDGFVDVVHDLNMVPYPFENSSIDEIHMYHVLEHLDEPIKKIEEMHRILKAGGILYIRVPHFSSMGAFTDLTHIRPFGYSSFDIFNNSDYKHYYANVNFKIVHKEIKYFGLYPNGGIYEKYIHRNRCNIFLRPIIRTINFFIKVSPTFFERIWCYWVGGAMEIVINFKKEEDGQ